MADAWSLSPARTSLPNSRTGGTHSFACKGEAGAKEAGKFRVEGRTYVVQDGDVLHFLFNA